MVKKVFLILFVLLVLLDLSLLNYKILNLKPTVQNNENSCSDQCRQIVAAAISSIPTSIPLPSLSPSPTNQITSTINRSFITSYLPIPGNGETLSNSWVNIPGTSFSLNTADYPTLKEAYLESNLRLFNGNGQAFIRLFDTTVGVEVWGSEISTGSQSFVFLTSGKITLRHGNHQYVIQLKSLTADTAIFNSARIKLISLN